MLRATYGAVTEDEVLGEAGHVAEVLEEQILEFLELSRVGLMLASSVQLVVDLLRTHDVVLEV